MNLEAVDQTLEHTNSSQIVEAYAALAEEEADIESKEEFSL